jgi:hypothetical protein
MATSTHRTAAAATEPQAPDTAHHTARQVDGDGLSLRAYTAAEVARLFRCHRSTITRAVRADPDGLGAIRLGRHLVFAKPVIDAILARGGTLKDVA